jgi:uncharacterized membrane protein YoaK (UPF0700 family)
MERIPADRLHLWLMLVLTFTTGINDAVGYLGLDKVFTGNMTGNVVVLGMALAGGSGLPVLGPALALIGFMAGAAIAGRVLRNGSRTWHGRTTVVFGSVAVIMLLTGAVLMTQGQHPSHGVAIGATTVAAVAMGLQAATARIIAVKEVTTVVVTSTITGLAADSVFGSGQGGASVRRIIAIGAILVGAVVGALLIKVDLGLALIVAGVLIATATVVGDLHDRATQG